MKTILTFVLALFLSANIAIAQDTLYIYKGNTVLYKQIVTNVDSITFSKKYPSVPTIPSLISINLDALSIHEGTAITGSINSSANLKSVTLLKDGQTVAGWPITSFSNGKIVGSAANGMFTCRIESLSAGNYTLKVIDNNNTEISQVFTIMPNPLLGLIKLSECYTAGAKVQIFGKKNFFIGYNDLSIVLLDSITNDTLKDARIYLLPLMTISPTVGAPLISSCPIENPSRYAINGIFKGALVFLISSTGNTWKLQVSIKNYKTDKEATVNLDITVDTPITNVMNAILASTPDSSKLFLSILQPSNPKIGINDIEFTLHKKMGQMEFPADSTYTLGIIPTLPSMGHGSPNNVNPVHVGNGHYKGKVNFTMTGDWEIKVIVNKDSIPVSIDKYFKISL